MIAPFDPMETARLFAGGFLLSVSLCLDIGVVNAAIMEAGARKGFFPAFLLGLGSCLGDLFYGALSISGLVMMFHLPYMRISVWIGGNCLLILMIVNTVRAALGPDRSSCASSQRGGPKRMGHLGKGILLSVVSPSSILWFSTVGSVAVASRWQEPCSLPVVFLAGFLLAGVTWSLVLAAASASSARLLGKRFVVGARLLSAAVLAALCAYSIYSGLREML